MGGSVLRITGPTRAVLEAFLEDPDADLYGLQIGASAGLASGTVHPILARLERLEWVASGWEDGDPAALGRPRRRFYRLTAVGVARATAALRAADERRARLMARPRPPVASPRGGG